jgi:hypothetical protein
MYDMSDVMRHLYEVPDIGINKIELFAVCQVREPGRKFSQRPGCNTYANLKIEFVIEAANKLQQPATQEAGAACYKYVCIAQRLGQLAVHFENIQNVLLNNVCWFLYR